MRRGLAEMALLAAISGIAACGSSAGGALFSDGSGGATGSGGLSTSSGGSSGSAGTPAEGGAKGAGGTQGTGGSLAQGGSPSRSDAAAGGASGSGGLPTGGSAGAGGGSGGAAAPDGSVSSGGQGGASSVVACENATCSVSSQERCCFGDGVTPYCYSDQLGGQCTCSGIFCTSIVVECDGPEDCNNGQLCCGEMGLTDSVYTHLYCRSQCDGGITVTRTEICHVGGGDACTNGSVCSNDGLVPTAYGDCG